MNVSRSSILAMVTVIAFTAPNTNEQRAKSLFEDNGLKVPEVEIKWLDQDECAHYGSYSNGVIKVCDGEFGTLLHELAHAWLDARLSDENKAELIEIWGLETWASQDYPWILRGAERAAEAVELHLRGNEPTSLYGERMAQSYVDILTILEN